ncbi:MAG: hypothetical protein ACOYS2_02140 [Patescibacteria group bacterium]
MKKTIAILFIGAFVACFSGGIILADSGSSTPVEFKNPIGSDSASELISDITDNLNEVLITIAIAMILIGGIMYMLSFGNEKNMERAKNVVFAAVIGLAIALSAKMFLQTLWDVLGVGSEVESPGGENATVVLGRILELLLSVVGIIAIISLLVGGSMYLTAYGDDKRAETGKKIVVASLIGIGISIGAVVLVKQVGSLLGYDF